jgi:hypothetical protein
MKEFFSLSKEQFQEVKVSKNKQKETKYNIQYHDSKFKPSGNHFNDGIFSYPKYVPEKEEK